MPEHYTRNTESVTAWCAKCQKMTTHRVDGGRRGPCLDPEHPQPPVRANIPKYEPPKDDQGKLF